MSMEELSSVEARQIIESLTDGIVPRYGAQLFTAGRERWLESLDGDLADLGSDQSNFGRLRIFNGRNGDGKTHLMHLLKLRATAVGFAVSYVTISEQIPLSRWDRVYAEMGRSIATKQHQEPVGLRTILNRDAPDAGIADNFDAKAASLRSVRGLDPNFAVAVYRYCTQQIVNVDAVQDLLLLGAWLEGHSERLEGLAVQGKVGPENGAAMFRSLVMVLRHFGFRGLVVMIDEVENVLNLPADRRRSSYRTFRSLVDRETLPSHSLVVASTTPPMFTDPSRGMQSYPALWSRIRPPLTQSQFVNYNSTLVDLTRTPLSQADYVNIGHCIRSIHAKARNWDPGTRFSDEFLHKVAKIAAEGRLTLSFSPTRVFVRLITVMLELLVQHEDFQLPTEKLDQLFGETDRDLGASH